MKKAIILMTLLSMLSFSNDNITVKEITQDESNKNVNTLKEIEKVTLKLDGKTEEESLILTRDSIKNYVSERDLDLTEKKLVTGKFDAIKKTATKFDYDSDSIYEVYASPDFLTTIKLDSEEEVTFVASGDTEKWDRNSF